jgi:hypothetical protein
LLVTTNKYTCFAFFPYEMSSIGPELPPHLVKKHDADFKSEGAELPSTVVGPQIPPHLVAGPSKQTESEDDDDDFGPVPPPSDVGKGASLSRKIFGPSLPPQGQTHDRGTYANDNDDDSDDDIGPMPLPAGISFEEADGVREFMEREERRRKQIEVSSCLT